MMCPTSTNNKAYSTKSKLSRTPLRNNHHRIGSVHLKRSNPQEPSDKKDSLATAEMKNGVPSVSGDPPSVIPPTPHDLVRQLVEHHRTRLNTVLEDQEFVQSRVDQLATLVTTDEKLVSQLRQRETQVKELQRTLSDMQLGLFQEREHVLRLYAELDHLKIQGLKDKRTIEDLLRFLDLTPPEMTHSVKIRQPSVLSNESEGTVNSYGGVPPGYEDLKSTPSRNAVGRYFCTDTSPEEDSHGRVSQLEYGSVLRELESLKATVKSLRTQLSEQMQTAHDRIDSLLDDRRMLQEANDDLHSRYEERLNNLDARLKQSQTMLVNFAKDFLARRNQYLQFERTSLEERVDLLRHFGIPITPVMKMQSHSDTVLQTVEGNKELSGESLNNCPAPWQKLICTLGHQLDEQRKLGQIYQAQIGDLEQELSRYRGQAAIPGSVPKIDYEKLQCRLQLANKRYNDLERRRRLEMEGYRNDVNALRKKLDSVEKQLLQFVVSSDEGRNRENIDVSLLKQVEKSTANSVKIMDQLKSLKLKMYQLEDDFRKL